MLEIVSSSILDDARETLAKELHELHKHQCKRMFEWDMADTSWEDLDGETRLRYRTVARHALTLSGTTDIECSECVGYKSTFTQFSSDSYMDCPKCDNGVIKHKWKVSVTLENGELPDIPRKDIIHIIMERDRILIEAGYRQVVE